MTASAERAHIGARPVDQAPSFDELYAAHDADLTVQLYLYFGDRQEAHDIVQEAFCRAYARWRSISRYEDPVGWVRHVAWNLALSKWRRTRSAFAFLNRQRRIEPQVAGPGPERVAVLAALAILPEQQRRVVVLRYVADLTVPEIAERERVAEGTVKSWLHRARLAMAAHLKTDDAGEGAR
ncbi:RNA polymerase sigma factor [Actinoplanes sp. NPDC051494]|uniref:RNA polymerase sigma factor n=1 Tax=Actinoplanes sp. NPDC051494 TaxID=3363907 RepID=UPI0037B00BA4